LEQNKITTADDLKLLHGDLDYLRKDFAKVTEEIRNEFKAFREEIQKMGHSIFYIEKSMLERFGKLSCDVHDQRIKQVEKSIESQWKKLDNIRSTMTITILLIVIGALITGILKFALGI